MRRTSLAFSVVITACGTACGAAPAAPVAAGTDGQTAAAKTETAGGGEAPAVATTTPVAAAIPSTCAPGDGTVCVPDAAFVKRMCNASFPDVALVLMAKSAPFTRMYMKGDVDGWNADGGGSARARLRFEEEMLVLKRRTPPANGIVMGSGGAGYLVMRWDGNCYTLEDGELTTKRPAGPKTPPIPWRLLAESTKDALLKSPKVLAAYQRRGKECKGAISGQVTLACEKADTALSEAIVSEIRGGLVLPAPARLP